MPRDARDPQSSWARRARVGRAVRRALCGNRELYPAWQPQDRVKLDVSKFTLDELISCVEERLRNLRDSHKPIPHITRIALVMLNEATER